MERVREEGRVGILVGGEVERLEVGEEVGGGGEGGWGAGEVGVVGEVAEVGGEGVVGGGGEECLAEERWGIMGRR